MNSVIKNGSASMKMVMDVVIIYVKTIRYYSAIVIAGKRRNTVKVDVMMTVMTVTKYQSEVTEELVYYEHKSING